MVPFYGWASTVSRLQSHCQDSLIPQKFLAYMSVWKDIWKRYVCLSYMKDKCMSFIHLKVINERFMFAIYMYEYVCESALYFKHNWHCPMLLLISSTQNKPERVFNHIWHATFSEITLLHSHKFTVLFDNFFKENLLTASENLFTFSKRRDLQ